ncbi:MAG: methionyl-tRNA formyltransferase [Christensenellales bacterium]
MNIIFLGTPAFAVKPLDALMKAGHNIVGVVTKVDKVNARGNKVVYSEVKNFALLNNLPLFQFESIKKQGVEVLRGLNADIMITASYGQIISKEILDICKYGVLNIHASILPFYRGASPVVQSLLNGDVETGVTIMQTGVGLDDGDILHIERLKISDDDNQQTLLDKLSVLGAEAIVRVLDDIEKFRASAIKQEDAKATHCKKVAKEDAVLDFSLDAKVLRNKVRAYYGNPTAHFECEGVLYKLYECEVVDCECGDSGKVISYDKNNGFVIACGKGALKIKVIQKQGGKVLNIKDFMNGNKFEVGQKIN